MENDVEESHNCNKVCEFGEQVKEQKRRKLRLRDTEKAPKEQAQKDPTKLSPRSRIELELFGHPMLQKKTQKTEAKKVATGKKKAKQVALKPNGNLKYHIRGTKQTIYNFYDIQNKKSCERKKRAAEIHEDDDLQTPIVKKKYHNSTWTTKK